MITREFDTIAAISTPLGEGAIGIVRLSGTDSFAIAKKIFKGLGERAGRAGSGAQSGSSWPSGPAGSGNQAGAAGTLHGKGAL